MAEAGERLEKLDRRALLKGLAVLAGAAGPRVAWAQASVRLGLVVVAGPMAESMVNGTELGLADANALANLFGKQIELLKETTSSPEEALAAGLRLTRQERLLALIGGGDDLSAEALSDAARQGGALFFNVGASSDRLRGDRCHRQTFHVHPSLAMQVGAAGVWLIEERKLTRWALVTNDSPLGREVEEATVAFLTRRGATLLFRERLALGTTDWQPLLQRFRSVAPNVVLAGLDQTDLLGFVRQYRAAGLSAELAGVAPNPRVLFSADPDELAGVWPLVWHHELERFSARELNSKYRRRVKAPLDGLAWAAWAAVKLFGEAVVRGGAADAAGVLKFIEEAPPFDGHKGRPLTFREWDHQLRQPMYLARPRGKEQVAGRVGVLEVIAEVPKGDLDAIGPPRAESRCRFQT
jgi:branched-chain amino acid transport system substrate-binding protein